MGSSRPVEADVQAGRRYRPPRLSILREVKVDSPVHRISVEAKFTCAAAMSVILSYFPSWGTLAIFTVLLLLVTLLARVPSGALPRPPSAFVGVVVASWLLASISGGRPHVQLGPVHLGLGAADAFAKFVAIGVLLFYIALLIGWTTSLADVAPAARRMMRPLRLLRVPVDELAITLSLCLRSFPLMLGELRILVSARRLRPRPEVGPDQTSFEGLLREGVDVMVTALAVSIRRAGEMADAITARGGTGTITAGRRRFGWVDLVALVIVAGACTAAAMIPVPG